MTPKNSRVYINTQQIQEAIQMLAKNIMANYRGDNPLLLCVLNGSFLFFSDLVKELEIPLEVGFLKAKSYVGTESTGKVEVNTLDCDITDRRVILVEDIVDTGLTITKILEHLSSLNPKSVEVATLLDKPSRRKVEVVPEYVGLTIRDAFVIGYGLDLDGKYRNLKDIYIIGE